MVAVDSSFDGAGEPARQAYAVTPHDDNEVSIVPRALYIGVTGNVAVTMFNGDNVTFVGVPAGQFLPIRVKKVLATNTTATDIVALY